MFKLGYAFDVGFNGLSGDLSSVAITGKRTRCRDNRNVNFLVQLGAAASGTADVVCTVNQWQASSGGSAQPYVCDHLWIKSATTLANTESWVNVANAAVDGTIKVLGATNATKQVLAVIEVHVPGLLAGYDYVSVDIATVAVARTAFVTAIPADLNRRRGPANEAPLLS